MKKNILVRTLLTSLLGLVSFLTLVGCSSVQTQTISTEENNQRFVLKDFYHEPPISLESRSLASAADNACPTGYDILLRQASKNAELGQNHVQCASGGCDYVLEWRIICAEKPEKKFSIFGKF